MYTVRMHVIKLLFVFILQTCSLLERGPSQEPRRVEGKLFILPTSAVAASSEWLDSTFSAPISQGGKRNCLKEKHWHEYHLENKG